jgi:hypothetical protein
VISIIYALTTGSLRRSSTYCDLLSTNPVLVNGSFGGLPAYSKSELPKGCTDAESGRLDHYCFGESENLRIDQGSASEEILNVVKCES